MPTSNPALTMMATQTQVLTQGVPVTLTLPIDPLGVAHGVGATGLISPSHALIGVEGNAVRWGLNPSATNGIVVPAGGQVSFMDANIEYRGTIRQVSFVSLNGPATLQIQFFN